MGIANCRFPDSEDSGEFFSPFFTNSPLGLYLATDGRLVNSASLRLSLDAPHHLSNDSVVDLSASGTYTRHLRSQSDQELILNILADNLHLAFGNHDPQEIRFGYPLKPPPQP
jgi:amidophosphoribosyltransferase